MSCDKIILEDCIMQKGKSVSAGSKILENFISPLNADAVDKIAAAGKEIGGRVGMSEFGISRVSDTEEEELSGLVTAIAKEDVCLGLGNDFSGMHRRQAPENGVCYIHPTYGSVSRFGLIPAVASMDQIGVACRDLKQGFELLSVIAGNDERDGAMFPNKSYTYQTSQKALKIGVPKNVMALAEEKEKARIADFVSKFETVEFELEYFEVYAQVMYILECAEISNNTNRYDGVKFGYRTENYRSLNDLYLNTRTEALGIRAKLAAIMGSMVLSHGQYEKYYDKAMKIRRLIKESLRFDRYDAIVLPTGVQSDASMQNALYALAGLAGLPALSFPYGDGGIQLVAGVKEESTLLTAWEVAKK